MALNGSLNVLSGLVAGNFSGYWLGISIVILTGIAYYFLTQDTPEGNFKDLRAVLNHVAERAEELRAEYGQVSKASIGRPLICSQPHSSDCPM